MDKIAKYIFHPQMIVFWFAKHHIIWLSDKMFTKLEYYSIFGVYPDLNNPKKFSEKIEYIKLRRHGQRWSKMVDKILAKEYVSKIIGSEYVVPTFQVCKQFDEIDFDALPSKFVIKCNHDSGGLAICRDKKRFDIDAARKKINKSLKNNFYDVSRERIYKDIRPRILVEQYLVDKGSSSLRDYKFYCFNGEPLYLYVSEGLENHETARIEFFDMDFKPTKFHREDYRTFENKPAKPKNFRKMISLARKLSQGIDFVRVDFYNIDGKIFFSELTFTPCAGLMPITPANYDRKLGDLLEIDERNF